MFSCLVYHERNSILYHILFTLFYYCLLILKAINNHPNPNCSTNGLSKEPYTNYSFIFINLTSRRREKLKFIWFFYHDFFCYFLYYFIYIFYITIHYFTHYFHILITLIRFTIHTFRIHLLPFG